MRTRIHAAPAVKGLRLSYDRMQAGDQSHETDQQPPRLSTHFLLYFCSKTFPEMIHLARHMPSPTMSSHPRRRIGTSMFTTTLNFGLLGVKVGW